MPANVLEAELPGHWGRLQRTKNTAIYWAVRLAAAVLRRLPFAFTAAVTAVVARLACGLDVPDRRRAERQIAQAIAELDAHTVRRTVRAMFRHFGRSAAELAHLERFVEGPHAVRIDPAGRSLLDAALAEGKGVVAVTGHIGNWELMAQVIAVAGYPLTTIAKPLYDPRLTRWVHAERTAHGMRIIWRGDSKGSRDMLRVFRNQGMLGLLIDQDTKVQGDFVPFFGRPAFTPTAAATLALRFKAPIVLCWIHRTPRGEHRIHVERIAIPPHTDAIRLTAALTVRLEAAIRAAPEQWVWLHRRWRRRPDNEPAEPAES